MASNTFADIQNVVSGYFAAELERIFNYNTILLAMIPKKRGTGPTINWNVRPASSATAGAKTEGAAIVASDLIASTTLKASLGYGIYTAEFGVTGFAQAIAASFNPGQAALEIFNQFETNLKDRLTDMAFQLENHLWTGNGAGTAMTGFIGGGAIANSGIYAGINRATYSSWSSTVLANGGTPRALTKSLIDQLEAQIWTACGRPPTCFVTTANVVTKYEGLFANMQRVLLERGDVSPASPNAGNPFLPANSGYTGFSYKGIPIYRALNVPTGTLAALNLDYVEFQTLPPGPSLTATMAREISLEDTSGRSTGISCKVHSLGKQGDEDRFQIVVYPQVVVRRPFFHGLLRDIDES